MNPATGHQASTTDRATPLELFFDLVYVFAFTQVTHAMVVGGTVQSVLGGLAVLGVLWWSWASHAWLANQRATDRGPVRIGIIVAIALVLIISIAIPSAYPAAGESQLGAMILAIGFIGLSIIYTIVNVAAAPGDRAFHRQVFRTMGVTLLPVSAGLIIGAVLGGTAQIALWLLAVAVEGVTVFTTSRNGRWELPSSAHWAERHGLVVMLALGESIISIGTAATDSPLMPVVLGAAVLSLGASLALWWSYFGRIAGQAEDAISALRGHRRTTIATVGTYLHLGIVAGILLISSALGGVIEAVGASEVPGAFNVGVLVAGTVLYSGALLLFRAASGARCHNANPRTQVP